MAFLRELLQRFLRGSVLAVPSDQVPAGAMRVVENARWDRVGTLGLLSSRPGSTALRATALAGGVLRSLHRLAGRSAGVDTTFGYCHVGSTLVRVDADWEHETTVATGLGTTPVSSASILDGDTDLRIYFANGTTGALIKDDGTTTTAAGIPAPTAPPLAAALATDLFTQIDVLDATAHLTGTNIGGLALSATIKQQGTNSITFTVAAGTVGDVADGLGAALDLDVLTGGDATVKDDDYIHLLVRADFPEHISGLQLDFDLDTATLANAFADNYYSVWLPGRSSLNQGHDQWTKVQVPKAQCHRFGTTMAKTWATVLAWRVRVVTNSLGSVTIWLDDFKLRGGTDLTGMVRYTAIYRNNASRGIGNPPTDSDDMVEYTTPLEVDRQRVNVTISNVISGGADHPGDTQITHLWLYRSVDDGTALRVAIMVDTAASPHLDDTTVLSTLLSPFSLETDNDMPPNGKYLFGPGAQNRLFMLVGRNRLRFSKAWEDDQNRAENWPLTFEARIGDTSEEALYGSVDDASIYVRTLKGTYEIVGHGADTYIPVPIPGSRGQVGPWACTSGDGRSFFAAQDGIYEQVGARQTLLTEAIMPFFAGETVDGVPGWSTDPDDLRAVSLEWAAHALGPLVKMLYLSTGTTGYRELTLKKNLQTGQYTEVLFDTRATPLHALFFDAPSNTLFAGTGDGQVLQLEDETATTDAGAAIAMRLVFPSSHQQAPTQDKHYGEVILEGNTQGQAVTVTATYDRGATNEALGSLTTTTDTGHGLLPVGDPTAAHQDIAYTLAVSATSRVDIARIGVTYERQPERLTYWESGLVAFGPIVYLKDLWYDVEVLSTVTAVLYLDTWPGRLHTILPTGRQQFVVDLPAGLKGRMGRLTLSSAEGFRLYQVQARGKPVGSLGGYTPIAFGSYQYST